MNVGTPQFITTAAGLLACRIVDTSDRFICRRTNGNVLYTVHQVRCLQNWGTTSVNKSYNA